ncbi:MAG TPA: DoxX family protein [Bellilinea sp.]|nr:DoxX family protein [Bellilinea sp.]
MNTVIWIAQILLALAFAGSGISKLAQPYEKLAARMGYVNDFTPGAIRAIGTLEVLGAIGVVLPAWTGILPWLTPLAAGGLAVNMGGAVSTHLRRKEYPMIIVNLILLALAGFVTYGRLVAVPL